MSAVVTADTTTGLEAIRTPGFDAPPAGPTARGATFPDVTVNVAASKDGFYPLDEIFRQTGDEVYVDCDVAAKVACIAA